MEKSQYIKLLKYWSVGIHYLQLVEAVANETIQQGNPFSISSDDEISLDRYELETKWSDFNLVVPLLFDFYYGIEVILKGFLESKNISKKHHKISDLLNEFDCHFPDHELTSLLSVYIIKEKLPEPLATFCSHSDISIDDYYQALKYPENTKGTVYKHDPLKYKSDAGLPFFKALVTDIKKIRKSTVALGRSINPMK